MKYYLELNSKRKGDEWRYPVIFLDDVNVFYYNVNTLRGWSWGCY